MASLCDSILYEANSITIIKTVFITHVKNINTIIIITGVAKEGWAIFQCTYGSNQITQWTNGAISHVQFSGETSVECNSAATTHKNAIKNKMHQRFPHVHFQ